MGDGLGGAGERVVVESEIGGFRGHRTGVERIAISGGPARERPGTWCRTGRNEGKGRRAILQNKPGILCITHAAAPFFNSPVLHADLYYAACTAKAGIQWYTWAVMRGVALSMSPVGCVKAPIT